LVVVDNFSKLVELFPVRSMDAAVSTATATATATARCLVQIFVRYGHMRFIIILRSHRGANFVGDVCKTLLELWS
jgi:hypothetical protein